MPARCQEEIEIVIGKVCLSCRYFTNQRPHPHSVHPFLSRVKPDGTEQLTACTRVQGGRLLPEGRKGLIGQKLVEPRKRVRGLERVFSLPVSSGWSFGVQ